MDRVPYGSHFISNPSASLSGFYANLVPIFASGRASPGTEYPGTPAPLAGKSTLSRLEQSWETGNRRYHQMVPNLKSLSNLFVALFLDACDTPPARITPDIDATDVETQAARTDPKQTCPTNAGVQRAAVPLPLRGPLRPSRQG